MQQPTGMVVNGFNWMGFFDFPAVLDCLNFLKTACASSSDDCDLSALVNLLERFILQRDGRVLFPRIGDYPERSMLVNIVHTGIKTIGGIALKIEPSVRRIRFSSGS